MTHRTPTLVKCLTCGKPFESARSWHKFCSSKCRTESWQNKELALAEHACTYCGVVSNTVDHIPPQSIRPLLLEMGLDKQYPNEEVPCCRECNSSLNDKALWTVAKRKAYIKLFLKRKYKRYLNMPDWSEEELRELSQTLFEYTLQGLAIRELTKKRIAY